MLPKYIEHLQNLKSQNRDSFIAPILGTFRIKLQGLKGINVLIMRNSIVKINEMNSIQYKFDLKGSKVNRRVLPLNANNYNQSKFAKISQQVLKD